MIMMMMIIMKTIMMIIVMIMMITIIMMTLMVSQVKPFQCRHDPEACRVAFTTKQCLQVDFLWNRHQFHCYSHYNDYHHCHYHHNNHRGILAMFIIINIGRIISVGVFLFSTSYKRKSGWNIIVMTILLPWSAIIKIIKILNLRFTTGRFTVTLSWQCHTSQHPSIITIEHIFRLSDIWF